MIKLYQVRLNYNNSYLDKFFIHEYDEEVLRHDNNFICTQSNTLSIGFVNYPRGKGQFYNSDDITEKIRVECSVTNYGEGLDYDLFLGFIYDDSKGDFDEKKKLVRALVVRQYQEELNKKIELFLNNSSKINHFIQIGEKEFLIK